MLWVRKNILYCVFHKRRVGRVVLGRQAKANISIKSVDSTLK